MALWGVIGGSGLDTLPGLEVTGEACPDTPYGKPSDNIVLARWYNQAVAFLARHGSDHQLAPHQINYRANLWALKALGVEQLVAVNAVGAIAPTLVPGDLVVPDQILDYTWGREQSFNLRPGGYVQHIDFTEPYTSSLRQKLTQSLIRVGVQHCPDGVYACTQGPRLETAAEVQRLVRDGATLIGMTGMPEAALARELELDYAALCLVVNRAAGLDPEPLDLPAIMRQLQDGMVRVRQVLSDFLEHSETAD